MKKTKVYKNLSKCGYKTCIIEFDTHFCGYVAVPEDSILYGLDYDDKIPNSIEATKAAMVTYNKRGVLALLSLALEYGYNQEQDATPLLLFNVHGGITFAGKMRNTNEWYFGFDCHHLDDSKEVQDKDYVEAECELLAEQIHTFLANYEKN